MTKILEFKNVQKTYGDNIVVDNFNLQINQGDFICIVGTSGSGKTTILKMVNQLIKPDLGSVLIKGQNVSELDLLKLRKKIGYAIQGNGLFPHMNVYENIAYVLNLEKKDKDFINKRVDQVMELVGLDKEILERYPSELSGGQQQRVGIARAYANEPEILLMDEPFGAVDSITRYQLQQDLKDIHQKTNCTIIFITHDMFEAFKLGTHILVMDQGKIVQFGLKEDVWHNPSSDFVKRLIKMTGME